MNEVWYLLYGGQSPDGRGEPKYTGRTLDKKVALAHFNKVKKSAFSIGKVVICNDTKLFTAVSVEDFDKT